jgi:rhodanese-related sulfurtransferase/molybdopterin-guanine dinucleotide biosynthesis protein A
MGTDKALLALDGAPMAVRVAAAMGDAGVAQVLALGGDVDRLRAVGLRAEPDAEPGAGPYAATLHALRLADHELVLVASCDLLAPSPSAMAEVVRRLDEEPDAVAAVPEVGGHLQWTHAAWRRSAGPLLAAPRARGVASLKRAAEGLPLLVVRGLPPVALADADAPSDLPGTLLTMPVPEIDVHELAAAREAGAVLIDVREPNEHEEARVPGAVLIPLGQVPDRVEEIPADGTVYVICARGGRSAKAVEHLRARGIDAVNVAGGTIGWIDAGLPTDSGPLRSS